MIRYLSIAALFFIAGCGPSHFIARQASGVTLYLDFPKAGEVLFVSSVDSFQPQPTQKNPRGVWVISAIAAREFHYFYVVDGRVYVPDCQYKERDDFGATNCIYQP